MLRLAQKSDLPSLLEIETLTQYSPWNAETFVRCWEAGYTNWVVERESNVVGFIVVSFQAGEGHILNLGVHPLFQRQGLGAQLLNHALSSAKMMSLNMAFLEVRRGNTKAIALYEKMGFIQVGERKGYYPALSGREDALIFAKDLGVK